LSAGSAESSQLWQLDVQPRTSQALGSSRTALLFLAPFDNNSNSPWSGERRPW
jgi:hypothetical protein